VAQAAACLLCKDEALGSTPSPTKKIFLIPSPINFHLLYFMYYVISGEEGVK
jgi:hypothetical protein